jgi:AraC-like DNA-binding protein
LIVLAAPRAEIGIMSAMASPDSPLLRLVDAKLSEALFDRVPNVVFFVKDRAGRYVLVNETLRARCAVAHKSDLMGRTAQEVFRAPLGARYSEQDTLVLSKAHEIHDKLERHLYPGGAEGWCLTWKAPLRGADRRVQGLVGLSRDVHGPDDRHPEYRRLAEAVDFLREKFDEPLRMTALARRAGLSLDRLERLVHRVYGLSPRQLLTKTRIDAASELLRDGHTPIAEIAYACGYADHSAFTRQFRAMTGLTPRSYRSLHAQTS